MLQIEDTYTNEAVQWEQREAALRDRVKQLESTSVNLGEATVLAKDSYESRLEDLQTQLRFDDLRLVASSVLF